MYNTQVNMMSAQMLNSAANLSIDDTTSNNDAMRLLDNKESASNTGQPYEKFRIL